ncbi:hypothetical protein [Ponticaulis sp.]|uniref:hypothetical protein n=1 Tax=Ponticaulis sp. TaxID=2020902 RepID=UPI000C678317|nr:hypothetical protein [Ponticaulis sp.]MAF56830.1 hypothetical protein [Ponticaulis sp.]MBN03114.1 hypothetical protein [Ponticaulis sp.]|tara:strand:- start:119 stop:733 length:615 start_codon:yes stop_codon:yes gene_type:complete
MDFSRFHEIVRNANSGFPVRFSMLREKVHFHHPGINHVKLYPVDLGTSGERTAHYVLKDDPSDDMRESADALPCFNAEIRFCENLRDDHNDFNFVMTKELMHVFDNENERVGSAQSFKNLLRDAETRQAPGVELTPEFRSEYYAYWRALVILCPIEKRNELKLKVENLEASHFDVSEDFMIRTADVPAVLSDNFEAARRFFLGA